MVFRVLKQLRSPTAATRAVAVTGPMPSISPSFWHSSLVRYSSRIRRSQDAILRSSSINSAWTSIISTRSSVLRSSGVFPMIAARARRSLQMSRAMTMPCSARMPRIWLTSFVRLRTKRWRIRWRAWIASCSGDFGGTKRIVGRPTASQIASASFRSFLFDLTYGATN